MPSLAVAFNCLVKNWHPSCASTLFFFSDGKPSDGCTRRRKNRESFPECLFDFVNSKCGMFGDRLTFSAFGFGQDADDFMIMREMINTAKTAGAKASFAQGYRHDGALASSISNTLTSTLVTRSLLSTLTVGGTVSKVRTNSLKASLESSAPGQFTFNRLLWTFYNPRRSASIITLRRLELRWLENERTGGYGADLVPVSLQNSTATGIAVSKAHFGEGAERLVYLMTEINAANEAVGAPLVAKVSLYKHMENNTLADLRDWHKTFVKIQDFAAKVAIKFSNQLNRLGVSKAVPRVMFLPCCVYEGVEVIAFRKVEFSFLVESRLDHSHYTKWNDNTGRTDGVVRQNAVSHEPFSSNRARKRFDTISEGDENEEDDDDGEQVQIEAQCVRASHRVRTLERSILEGDVPQAFSHFSHRVTGRKKLICDLQGVLTVEDGSPIFKWTDPCIHSTHTHYGRTDNREAGIRAFFKTHQCNVLCELLGIANSSLDM